MGYRYLEEWTRADVAFEASGNTLEELFHAAADALMNVMVGDLRAIELRETRQENFVAESEAELLHDFLQKLIYYKDADQLLLRASRISISRGVGRCTLEVELRGEELNPKKHELIVDVKAVTHHRFDLRRDRSGWRATVVLDV